MAEQGCCCCKSTGGRAGTSGFEIIRMKSASLATLTVAAATSSPVFTVACAKSPVASCTYSSSCREVATAAAAAAIIPPPTASLTAPVRPSRSPAGSLAFVHAQPMLRG